ncbi:hypothetical protein DN402_04320 [Streptomyces sp. SW4]|nr:hypothetical protein DN402_04320 [Streptomyces sp. SW4]
MEEALARYDAIRRPETTLLLDAHRRMEPDPLLHRVEILAPDGFSDIRQVLSDHRLADIRSCTRKVTGVDAAGLNARSSWSVRPGGRTHAPGPRQCPDLGGPAAGAGAGRGGRPAAARRVHGRRVHGRRSRRHRSRRHRSRRRSLGGCRSRREEAVTYGPAAPLGDGTIRVFREDGDGRPVPWASS